MPAEDARPFAAIVLAAQRAGRIDPLAAEAGVTHKCLVPVLGRPMILYVLEALAPAAGLERIRISIEPEAVEAVREAIGAFRGPPVDFVPSRPTITESTYAAAEGVEGPILITTADNVNLSPGAAEHCLAPIAAGAADVTLAFASRESVLAARSEAHLPAASTARIGPYRFADGRFSNCNLYALAGPEVLKMAETFREGGQFSKSLRRLVNFIGLSNIVLYALRALTLERAMRRLSRKFGVRLAPVLLEDGAHAVDIDNPRTYRIAEAILARRAPA